MIETKKQLKEFINYEKILYGKKHKYVLLPRMSEKSIIWKYICLLRLEEYSYNTNHKLRYIFYKFLRLKMSRKYLIQIPKNVVDKGLKIFHVSPTIINAKKIGKNLMLGPNVYMVAQGRTGDSPTLGDDIAIGASATLVGGINLASGIAIGANSLVNKSFEEENITIAGNPAKKINSNGSKSWGGTRIFKSVEKLKR